MSKQRHLFVITGEGPYRLFCVDKAESLKGQYAYAWMAKLAGFIMGMKLAHEQPDPFMD